MSFVGKTALIVGGTQGIGAATARKLASEGAKVTIIGRNKELGQQTSQDCQGSFHAMDITHISQVIDYCKSIEKPDYLVLCAGGLNYGPRRVTAEGVEVTFCQNYLSRMAFCYYLGHPDLKVMNVLGASVGKAIDPDYQLTKHFSFIRAASQVSSLTDVMTKVLNTKQIGTFQHMAPGIVNTKSAANQGFPWWITFPASFVLPLIGSSPESIATVIADHLVHSPGGLYNVKKPVKLLPELNSPQLEQDVFDYTMSLLKSLEK